jgi:hypothetical protein
MRQDLCIEYKLFAGVALSYIKQANVMVPLHEAVLRYFHAALDAAV